MRTKIEMWLFAALSCIALATSVFKLNSGLATWMMLGVVFGYFAGLLVMHQEPGRRSKSLSLPRMAHFNRYEIARTIIKNVRSGLSLHDNGGAGVAIVGSREEASLVAWAMQHFLNERELETLKRAVHEAICGIGREMFLWHQKNPEFNYPDHSVSPQALGYAIKHGALTQKEIASIRFDMGDTAEDFTAAAEGLLERVMAQLAEGSAYLHCLHQTSGSESGECLESH